jgi:hypothetical protein
MYWLLGRKSHLTTSNKLLICKAILKPIWTYGIQLLGSASICNIEILEHFQLKALRMIRDRPWYVSNVVIRQDLQIPIVEEQSPRLGSQHSTRLNSHPNNPIENLTKQSEKRQL